MSKAKCFVARKPSTGEIIAISANQICATEIPWRYKNVVLYSPDPFSSWNVDGGLGTRLVESEFHLHFFIKVNKIEIMKINDFISSIGHT